MVYLYEAMELLEAVLPVVRSSQLAAEIHDLLRRYRKEGGRSERVDDPVDNIRGCVRSWEDTGKVYGGDEP